MKDLIKRLISIAGVPFTYLSSLWLKLILRIGIYNESDKIFMSLGILPVEDHYYQPLINPKKHLTRSLREDRTIRGLDFNIKEQLEILKRFDYNQELESFPLQKKKENDYYYCNISYGSGDSEYLYNMIRYFKPENIIEIGAGYSTLMIQNAIAFNRKEKPGYLCNHICVEPYEKEWLEKLDVTVIRTRAELVEKSIYLNLKQNDVLFIDSSHIIRPQGDILFEYLELLPELKSGVLVHFHDIFTPKDYLNEWIFKYHLLWNEQYLLEAFLAFNKEFRIIGALNYLSHNYLNEFSSKCPVFAKSPGREPGSFWIVKN